MATPSLLYLLLFCSQHILTVAQLQFISYNGTLSGRHKPVFGRNPFYFSLFALGNLANPPFPQCGDASCTFDSTYVLSFISAEDECIVNAIGQECNGVYSSGEVYYQPIEVLNLKPATIAPIQLAGASGRNMAGDQSTSGNLTVDNGFKFQQPHNYTLAGVTPHFDDPLFFSWNSSTPFAYTPNFTNGTTSAFFTPTAPYGVVTTSFSGSRVDDLHNYHPLNSSNPKVLSFMFANGSKIKFKGDVAFESQASSGFQMAGMQWIVSLMLTGLASFVLFF
ncbi:uncharacterized protein PAC_17470 [Phialocephala subalpina]|uniref:Peptidase A1 domain-containing protein n=1 Tax=Phialocephala subalpina TaxID=576137 RepID=A0A1L7XR84_9HELO|nr:uncharacterized protein PAC_17470 [Phialocephala subalpina]